MTIERAKERMTKCYRDARKSAIKAEWDAREKPHTMTERDAWRTLGYAEGIGDMIKILDEEAHAEFPFPPGGGAA